MVNVKSRYWTILVYPESAPENWEDILAGLTYCYKLHDHDVVKSTGELKKDHFHVVLAFDGPTTYNVVKELTDSLNSPIPKAVRSLRGMIRYLIHADNKNKYQYKQEDIVSVGMDQEIEQAFAPKKTDEDKKEDRIETGNRLVDVINANEFINWDQLITFLRRVNDKDLLDFVYNHAYLVQCLLLDCYHKLKRK